MPSVGQVLLQLPAGGRRGALDHMPKMSEGVTPLTSCTNLMDSNRDPPEHRLVFSVPTVANKLPVVGQVQGYQIPASVLVAEKDGSSVVAIRRGGGGPSVSNTTLKILKRCTDKRTMLSTSSKVSRKLYLYFRFVRIIHDFMKIGAVTSLNGLY